MLLSSVTHFQLNGFVQKYKREGPGTVGLDLDRGAQLMETYAVEFESMEKQRVELGEYRCWKSTRRIEQKRGQLPGLFQNN